MTLVVVGCSRGSGPPAPLCEPSEGPGTWTWIPHPVEVGDSGSAAVWTGDRLFAWGGNLLATGGALYHVETETWIWISSAGAPNPYREDASATWTGKQVVVWGGFRGREALQELALYEPSRDRWERLGPLPNEPTARYYHQTILANRSVVIWGGRGTELNALPNGARFDLETRTWTPLPQEGAPGGAEGVAMVWTGVEVLVWGGVSWDSHGETTHYDGARYDPVTNTWLPMRSDGAPKASGRLGAVWTGTEMVVWGWGVGGAYNPATDSWRAISEQGAPSKRSSSVVVWTGEGTPSGRARGQVIVWGGSVEGVRCNTGATYDVATDTWAGMSSDGPLGRTGAYGTWTGKEMVVFGGRPSWGVGAPGGDIYRP